MKKCYPSDTTACEGMCQKCSTYGHDTTGSPDTNACLLSPVLCASSLQQIIIETKSLHTKECCQGGRASPAGSEPGPELWPVQPQALAHCLARGAPVPPAQQCAGVPKPGPLPTALNMPVTCCCPLCMQCIRRTECRCCMPYRLCCCLHMLQGASVANKVQVVMTRHTQRVVFQCLSMIDSPWCTFLN